MSILEFHELMALTSAGSMSNETSMFSLILASLVDWHRGRVRDRDRDVDRNRDGHRERYRHEYRHRHRHDIDTDTT